MVTLDTARRSLTPDRAVVESLRLPIDPLTDEESQESIEARINQALMSAVHAFSARWLPADLFQEVDQRDGAARQRLMQTLWSQAHQDALQILSLSSYRSSLALYLFAITPTVGPTGSTPISQLCYETSLRHHLQLRLESRLSSTAPGAEPQLNHLQDSAYWFGLVCDYSRSLLRCQPPVLISGPSSQARVWRLVSQQVDDYGAVTIDHSSSSSNDLLTDATVLRILQLGSACKSLCWAAITDVQDSLFYNRTNLDLHTALEFSFTKLRQFELVFGPQMDHIAKDLLLLDEKSQLGYSKFLGPFVLLEFSAFTVWVTRIAGLWRDSASFPWLAVNDSPLWRSEGPIFATGGAQSPT
jgi:hypothetical protein